MTTASTPAPSPAKPEAHRADVARALAEAGFPPAAIEALLAFDAEHFLHVRRVMKGDIPQSLMLELDAGIELSQFHALSAILRIRAGHGRPEPMEPTVGLLAEEMNVDPSRASRIAADLVDRGLLIRGVSQEDGRRSILTPTEAATTLMRRYLQAKWQHQIKVFAGWSAEDLQTFTRLFARFNEGIRAEYPSRT